MTAVFRREDGKGAVPDQLQDITAVFVKDASWEHNKVKNVPLCQGVVDRKFFSMLKQANFTGPISIHVEYLDNKKERAVLANAFKNDLATLRSWLKD